MLARYLLDIRLCIHDHMPVSMTNARSYLECDALTPAAYESSQSTKIRSAQLQKCTLKNNLLSRARLCPNFIAYYDPSSSVFLASWNDKQTNINWTVRDNYKVYSHIVVVTSLTLGWAEGWKRPFSNVYCLNTIGRFNRCRNCLWTKDTADTRMVRKSRSRGARELNYVTRNKGCALKPVFVSTGIKQGDSIWAEL